MTCKTTLQTDSLHCVVSIITGNPQGLTLAEVAQKACLSSAYVKNLLTFGRRAGLLGFVQFPGFVVLWFTATGAEKARAELAAKQREAERNRHARRADAGYYAKRRGRELGRDLTDEPIRSWASASAPLPFKLNAPRSVFDWVAA